MPHSPDKHANDHAARRFPIATALAVLVAVCAVQAWTSTNRTRQPESLSDPARATERYESEPATTRPPERIEAIRQADPDAQNHEGWVLHGAVVDPTGRPLAGATIEVSMSIGKWSPSLPQPVGSTRSGADGRFQSSIESLRSLSTPAREQATVQVRCDSFGMSRSECEVHLTDVIRSRPTGFVRLAMHAETLVKGMVVDANGQPIAGASVAVFCASNESCLTDQHGQFDFAPSTRHAGEAVLFAVHGQHGRSRAEHVTIHTDRETRIPDLVIDSAGNRIRGRVLLPDDNPASSVGVYLETSPLPADIPIAVDDTQLSAEEYTSFFLDPMCEATTDDQGRFLFCNLLAGPHVLSADEASTTVLVGDRNGDHEVTLRLPSDGASSQIVINIEDEHGVALPDSTYAIHLWHDERATPAELRHARIGPTPDLLRTADESDLPMDGSDKVYNTSANTFAVVEASCVGRGPVYASCRLRPQQHRQSVTLVMAPQQHQGALHFDVDRADEMPSGPIWIRMCRGPTDLATALSIPDAARSFTPRSDIRGPWYELPPSNTVRGLPAGPLTIEVLAHHRDGGERVFDYPHTKMHVVVSEGSIEHVRVRANALRGTHLEIEFVLPVVQGTRAKLKDVRVKLRPAGQGPWMPIELTSQGTGHPDAAGNPAKGRHRFRSRHSFSGADYDLIAGGNLIARKWSEPKRGGAGRWRFGHWRSVHFKRTVSLRQGQAPTVLDPSVAKEPR